MTLNYRNAPRYVMQLSVGLAVLKRMKIDPYYQHQKDMPGSVDFSNAQIVHEPQGQ